jgi:hypothetical protein
MSTNLYTSFAATAHLTEGIHLNALIRLKVENCLVCPAGTNSVQYGKAIYFLLEKINEIKHQGVISNREL